MSIYIFKNGEQSGPFDEAIVLEKLRIGQLSRKDLAIRTGGTEWQPLGVLFPDVAKASQPPAPAAPPFQAPAVAATFAAEPVPAAKGGCRPVFGWLLLVFGLLLFLGGISGSGVNRMIQPRVCETADEYNTEGDRAIKDADAAKDTPRQAELEAKAKDKLESAQIWLRGCIEARSTHIMFLIALLAAAGTGFLLMIVGFFVRRVTPAQKA